MSLRRTILRKNHQRKLNDIVQTYVQENKRTRHYVPFSFIRNDSSSFEIIFPKKKSDNTIILLWNCCQAYEPVFADDFYRYSFRTMCQKCSDRKRRSSSNTQRPL